jgi:DNA-binding ferritin-like protein
MSAQQIHFFFQLRDQVKLYHWQTHLYARHKATDDVIKRLDDHIDLFVEVYMGKYGRPSITRTTNMIQVKNMADKSAVKFIKDCISHLTGPFTKSLKGADTDLLNIKDEILGELNKLLYLFTLG